MAGIDDKKSKIIDFLKEAEARKKTPRKKSETKLSQSIMGNGNIQAAGDIHINNNKKETIRTEFTPGPEHISAAQARKIQKLVEKAVTTEAAAGGDVKKLYAKWWAIVKDRYNVPSYLAIPAHQGDQAIAWLKQVIAINRPKLRRNDNETWRKDHYKAIWAKARQLGLSKGDVYTIVSDRIGVQVVSLTKLGEQNLKKLYNIIMAMK